MLAPRAVLVRRLRVDRLVPIKQVLEDLDALQSFCPGFSDGETRAAGARLAPPDQHGKFHLAAQLRPPEGRERHAAVLFDDAPRVCVFHLGVRHAFRVDVRRAVYGPQPDVRLRFRV